jgi:rubrerythrin
MKKTKLIENLHFALKTEEIAIVIYLNHLNAIVNRFDVEEDFIIAAKNIINKLILGDQAHKKKCEELLEYVKSSEKEDF